LTDVKKDTVPITVDGKQIDAEPGEMIIAAAERNGFYIPRFCYHPRMKPVGMCRMCLVDVKGPRGYQLQPACFIPVAEGQEVVTDSPRVKKAQDGVLEFLLVNHPLDCPVCDKGGECPLQDQTLVFGPGESRFVEEKRHWEKPIPLSGLVDLDRERCIQCARCTRFADEIAGDPLIDFANRGEEIEVATFPDAPFSSYFSGNTVQICPVGALTARPYRFRARPWDLEQVESTCQSCAVGCRIAVQSSSNRLTRYLGLDSDPVNHSWLCDKGRFDFESVNSDQRVSHPMLREGGELVPVGWGAALAAAAKALKDATALHGPTSIAVLGGSRLANEDAYAWARLAKGVLGTDNVDAQLGDGLPAELVLGLPRATIDEACGAPAVILLAPDLKQELPVLYLRLRSAAVDDGISLIELTPQATGLSRYAKATLTYRPGEAALVARALVDGTSGEVGGVSGDALAAARAAMADGAVVVLGRPSLAESAGSVADAAAILAQLPGVRFLPALRRANVMGALDLGLAPGVLPGRVDLDAGRQWFEAAWGGVPAARGLDAAGILTAATEGRLATLVLLGADPLADFPDRELARRGLSGAGFVIAVDTFLTESASEADVVLPAATFAERAGTTTNLEGRITRLGQKIVPPGVAWPDWTIAVELAVRLGQDLGIESAEALWDEIERVAPAHVGLTRAMLRDRRWRDGVVVPVPPEGAPETPERAVDPMSDPGIDAVETHGETAFREMGEDDQAAEGDGADGDAVEGEAVEVDTPARPPLLSAPVRPAQVSVPALDGYSLRLVVGRVLYDEGTLVQQSPSLAPLVPPVRLRVNHYDLDRLGVTTGGQVRLTSPRATMVVEVDADDGVPRGSAFLPFNIGRPGAADLIDSTATVNDVRLETL
jgi:NADH-quinone oxidoreductase subunit G